MEGLRVHATGIGLVLAWTTRDRTWLPIVLANAIVGSAYMYMEREALRTVGSRLLNFPAWKLTYVQNTLLNMAIHGVLTAVVVSRLCDETSLRAWVVMAMEVLGMSVLDLDGLYPSENGLLVYKMAHVAVLAAFLAVL